MTRDDSLYAAAVKVGTEFLGPAGERFMRRQISTHLDIEPEKLKPKQLPELVRWVRLTFAVLTDDADHVDEFATRLLALGEVGSIAKGKVAHGRIR